MLGGPGTAESTHAELPVLDIGRISTRYAITIEAADQPGVLATIAHVFADHGVSAGDLEQTINDGTGRATLVIGTHEARESALAETVRALADSPVVTSVASVIRVEGAE